MILTVNLDAIRHNARVVRKLAQRAGMALAAVVKEPFASPQIFDAIASTGVDSFWTSYPSKATPYFARTLGARRGVINLTVPSDAAQIIGNFSASLHVCEETLRAGAIASTEIDHPHMVWLGLLTSDDREGLRLDEIRSRSDDWRRLFTGTFAFGGLLANWGCRYERPPSLAEITAMFAAADEGVDLRPGPVPLSIGGSVLLPILRHLPPRSETQLRIGEAIVAGTVTGGGAAHFGLRRVFTLSAELVQVRFDRWSGRVLGLANCGANLLRDEDFLLMDQAQTDEWSTSGLTAFNIDEIDRDLAVGDSIDLAIGYASAVRTLSTKMVAVRYIESFPQRNQAA